jgi:predicted transport protein
MSVARSSRKGGVRLTLPEQFAVASIALRSLYSALRAFALGLGGDVEESQLRWYVRFRRAKSFLSVVLQAHSEQLVVFLRINPSSVKLKDGFSRDVSNVGHWGTGDVEITLRSPEDLEKVKPLILKSYQAN